MCNPSASPFSLDLIHESKQHVQFLSSLHRNGITLAKPTYESFRRYSNLWLPFVTKHKTRNLIPPADIAWLWHCHRLAPYRYINYVQKRFSKKDSSSSSSMMFLDPSHPFTFQMKDNKTNDTINEKEHNEFCKETIKMFQEMYPNENFFNDDSSGLDNATTPFNVYDNTKLDEFDVIESCIRQSTFLWQISGSNFSSDIFLQQGVDNYDKFIRLMKNKQNKYNKPQFIIPTYQIDLIWHTHIVSSIQKYHDDVMHITGTILEHDDSFNDRSEGSSLNVNFQATSKLWMDVYNEEYKVVGGMYRGEPPIEFFKCDWVDRNADAYKKNFNGLDTELVHLMMQYGASSHGKTAWMNIDDHNAFLPANPRSTTRGVNTNPAKPGYIFGKGGKLVFYC